MPREGVDRAAGAGAVLEAIHGSVQTIKDMNNHIAAATEQQSAVAESIHEAVVRISDASKRGADAGSRSEATAREMSRVSATLGELAGQFRV